MFKRYFLKTIAMVFVTMAFVHFADSQVSTSSSTSLVHFDSQPPLTGEVGVPYSYRIHLDGVDTSAIVRYSADRIDPPGFSVDSVSGIVSWTPAARGWYSLTLLAVVRNPTHGLGVIVVIPLRFMVAVAGGNGIVQGKVTDTLNVGIPNVVVEVLQAASPNLPDDGCYSYAARTDSNGNYRIARIDPGAYKLHAVSPSSQYASQWYDGQPNAAEANKISVADSPAVTIVNFTLTGGAARMPKITVSGMVTDSALLPIKNSRVFFVRAGFAFNSNVTIDDFRDYFDMDALRGDFRLEGSSAEVFQAKADSLGNYSLKIPAGSYIAFASAPGYGTIFYPGQSDLLSATMLVLVRDSAGINFSLPKFPPIALGAIEGSVLDSALDAGVPSRIIATRDRWLSVDKYKEPRSYVVDTDSLGNFTIGNLLPGSYFIFAVPLGNYAPAFYSSDTVTTRWKMATKVVVDGNTVSGIDIYVHAIPISVDGFADISGTLSLTSGSASTMAGAIVYATKSNVVAGFAITDVAGNYDINGLAPGTYSLSVDRPGYNETASSSGTVSYNAAGNPVNSSVPLSMSSVTLVGETPTLQPEQYSLGQNYPNPFNPSTTIRYTLPASGRVAVRVYNILGQVVATLVDGNQNAGTYNVTFNASALSSGVYFYRIESGSFSAVKKMMLLK
ncbi:MAG: carboxypeptidase regulatory-like domain-containing protein [Bacteroidota bacterium]